MEELKFAGIDHQFPGSKVFGTETNSLPAPVKDSQEEQQKLLREIRNGLKGQKVWTHHSNIAAQFGKVYSWNELFHRIRKSIPSKLFRTRDTHFLLINDYPRFIPDEALLKYHTARQTGYFGAFFVIEPVYATEYRHLPANDPWIIARIGISGDQYVVIAQWV